MKAQRLICRRPVTATDSLSADLHPVLSRIYRARAVATPAELEHGLDKLLPPGRLLGMERAVALLAEALRARKRILVVADFDADGATSCALVVRALRALGAADVRYVVPNRFEYGYGLTPEIVALAAKQQPDLIVTVDNGIASVDGVETAHAHGMQVLITDHHLPGASLPAAEAIVNPNQPGDSFPSKVLAGVGVAFYVMLALRAYLREQSWFGERTEARAAGQGSPDGGLGEQSITEPNLAQFLDLVALGTIADVVPLDHNNRILVAQGLARLNADQGCAGIRALLAVSGRTPGRLTASDLGFCVAPRLNAAGRLEDMSLGIECLLTDDDRAALAMAQQLDTLNRERRAIESDMQQQALAAVRSLHLDEAATGADFVAGRTSVASRDTESHRGPRLAPIGEAGLPRGLCLYDESWHQGVIGLVASRIKERVHRPVIAFALANDREIKGSARSVPGLHIRDALDNIAAREPTLLSKFGGHAMAAGLTLARDRFEVFARAFDEEVGRWLSEDDLRGRIYTDGELEVGDFSLGLAEALRAAGPWGQGFPEPLFDGCFDILDRRIVGEKHLKLTLRSGNSKPISAIAFHAAETPSDWTRIRAAFRLDVNEYQGNRTLQLVLEHLEPA